MNSLRLLLHTSTPGTVTPVKLYYYNSQAALWIIIMGHTKQGVWAFGEEGGIAKMVANKPAVDGRGRWLLPAWRENGGACQGQKQLHGAPAFLTSSDQAGLVGYITDVLAQARRCMPGKKYKVLACSWVDLKNDGLLELIGRLSVGV